MRVLGVACVAALAVLIAVLASPPEPARVSAQPPAAPAAARCDDAATPRTLSTVLAKAPPRATICLASGDYGRITGAGAAPEVTLRAAAGARPVARVRFDEAVDLVLDGLVIEGALLSGATRDVTIRNSEFTAPVTITGLVEANVLLEHNRHVAIDALPGASPARIHLNYSGRRPSGVTVRDSLLAGGDADGIQSGVGLAIIGNEFRDIRQKGPNHTDAIQLVGAHGSVVRGNHIHDSATGIVAYDGLAAALIEDNLIDLDERPWGIELYSDRGSVVRHNTLADGACAGGQPCGQIDVNRKPGAPPSRGTVLRDNVAAAISVVPGAVVGERGGNLVRSGAAPDDVTGAPRWAGGAAPEDRAGFRLAPGSPGSGAALDGSDPGIVAGASGRLR